MQAFSGAVRGMRRWYSFAAIGLVSSVMTLGLGASPGAAEPRPHVYLLRGLLNVFSLGMDTLTEELNARGVYATVYNHTAWEALADQAAIDYKAGKEGPIILIGHSLGANAVMEMSTYLGQKGVPVALVVPFDAAGSYYAAGNVARVLNLTQRNYAYMQRAPDFHGTLANVDVSSDPGIDHLNIDKSPRLHARVIAEVLAVIGGHRLAAPGAAKPTPVSAPAGSGEKTPAKPVPSGYARREPIPATPAAPAAAPAKSGTGANNSGASSAPAPMPSMADGGTPIIAAPESRGVPTGSIAPTAPAAPPARKPVAPPQPAAALQLPN